LDKDTAKFCKELWNLCLSAQANPQGVPKELLEAKKLELRQEKVGECSRSMRSVVLTSISLMRRRPPKKLGDAKNRSGPVNESSRPYARGRELSGPGDGEVVLGVAETMIEEISETPAPH
jgi:serine/arginine repetitive matrix protein 1